MKVDWRLPGSALVCEYVYGMYGGLEWTSMYFRFAPDALKIHHEPDQNKVDMMMDEWMNSS